MIIFRRTENIPKYGDTFYDDVELKIGGGYETTLDEYIHYFIVFLQALTFERESIIDGFKDYLEDKVELQE
jgi:hypothetical protein